MKKTIPSAEAETEWKLGYLLPNLNMTKSYGNQIARIVPFFDPIVQNMCERNRNIEKYLSSFRDQFNNKIWPSALVYRSEMPKITGKNVEVVASFRDILAISSIAKGWTQILAMDGQLMVVFSETFDLYPWELCQDENYVISFGPSGLGLHFLNEFSGQSTPALPSHTLMENNVDEPLYKKLLDVWDRKFVDGSYTNQDTATLRSLRMAYEASQMPGQADSTHFDIGTKISLWVSAFEILVHPKYNRSNVDYVCEALRNTPWIKSRLSRKYFNTPQIQKNASKLTPSQKISLPEWIYRKLNNIRNDYIHGNEIDETNLIIKGAKKNILVFAAPLYRSALASILDLSWQRAPKFDPEKPDDWSQHIEQSRELKFEQSFNENALISSRIAKQQ